MVRQARLMAVVGLFLIGWTSLVVVGCSSGGRSEAPKEEEQGHTEATKEQAHSDRCEGTRTFKLSFRESAVKGWDLRGTYTTNDVPGCPKGGLLSGTDKGDHLAGGDGEDKVRSLGGRDKLLGGSGSDMLYGGADYDFLYGQEGDDVLYGGDGGDDLYGADKGKDVLYGGDGDDLIDALGDRQPDKLYCGEGWDQYYSDKLDHVSSSCEKKQKEIVVY